MQKPKLNKILQKSWFLMDPLQKWPHRTEKNKLDGKPHSGEKNQYPFISRSSSVYFQFSFIHTCI